MLSYLLGHVLQAEYATVPPHLSSITLNLTLKVIVVGFGDGHGALVQDTGTKTYSHYCRLLLQHAYFICTIAACLFHCITIAACLFHTHLCYTF